MASRINIDEPFEATTKCSEKILEKILCNCWITIILYCSEWDPSQAEEKQ
jgi:hypothetical protein